MSENSNDSSDGNHDDNKNNNNEKDLDKLENKSMVNIWWSSDYLNDCFVYISITIFVTFYWLVAIDGFKVYYVLCDYFGPQWLK